MWAVFLRDPLEILFSGYLYKFYRENIRQFKKHCEPNVVFNPDIYLVDEKDRKIRPLTKVLEGNDNQMFAA